MTTNSMISNEILGKTVRLTWTDGPTKGSTHEHIFHEDGTVEWWALEDGKMSITKKKAASDRPKYLARDVAEQVVLISYLSSSGYTLTVALNFRSQTTVGVASNATTWTAVEGTFAVEHQPAISIGDV